MKYDVKMDPAPCPPFMIGMIFHRHKDNYWVVIERDAMKGQITLQYCQAQRPQTTRDKEEEKNEL